MLVITINAKFFPGVMLITPGAQEAFQKSGESVELYLTRHLTGDWGELDEHDRQANEYALLHGLRLLSAYTLSDGTRIYIITESDRSATTVLRVDEY